MTDEQKPTDGTTAWEPGADGTNGSPEGGHGRELRKTPEAGVITGVCAGLGEFTRVDPIVWRVAFAVTGLAGGTGIWLYAGAWLLMRDAEGGPAMAEQLLDRRFAPEAVLTLLGLALAAATAISLLGGISGGTLMLASPLIIGALAAHNRGVDLKQALRELPTKLKSKEPPPAPPTPEPGPTYYNPAQPWASAPNGPVDLAVVARQSPHGAQAAGENVEDGDDDEDSCAPGRERRSAARDRRRAKRHERGVLLLGLAFWFVVAAAGITIGVSEQRPWAALLGPATGPVFLGSVVAIVGVALLAGTWFGNRRGLVTVGTLVSLLVLAAASTDLTGVRVAEEHWRPTTPAEARQYQLDGGRAELDLTALDVEPGERVNVGADVRFGQVEVLVPEGARVDVHATSTFGRIEVGDENWSGARLDVRSTMAPENAGAEAGASDGADRGESDGESDEEAAELPELNVRLASYGALMEVRRVTS
ncbi:PspC domain-containing protein [Halostreptopolyspora alba]|uniref:PspC domain-containing protein n=1 Tax=Halostreptopolyspora alba TaxID=2487137 RepID=A0A3N0E7X8_9ACTN|nr:PspC domain-containing protein [Nocardiopsaceae bacterium YIM 96095]